MSDRIQIHSIALFNGITSKEYERGGMEMGEPIQSYFLLSSIFL